MFFNTAPLHILENVCLPLADPRPFFLLCQNTKLLALSPVIIATWASRVVKDVDRPPLDVKSPLRLLCRSEQACILFMKMVENDVGAQIGMFEQPGRSPYNTFMKHELPKVKVEFPNILLKDALKIAANRWLRLTSCMSPMAASNYIILQCAECGFFRALRNFMQSKIYFSIEFTHLVGELRVGHSYANQTRVRTGWAVAFLAWLFREEDPALPSARAIYSMFPKLCRGLGDYTNPCFLRRLEIAGRLEALRFAEEGVGWASEFREQSGFATEALRLRCIDLEMEEQSDGAKKCEVQWLVSPLDDAENEVDGFGFGYRGK